MLQKAKAKTGLLYNRRDICQVYTWSKRKKKSKEKKQQLC